MYFKKRSFLFLFLVFRMCASAYELTFKNVNFNGGPFKYSIQSFIDARINKNKPVGFTRVGISNKTEGIYLSADFAQQCLSAFYSGNIKFDKAFQLIAVINQVTIQETHSGGWEYSTVSL